MPIEPTRPGHPPVAPGERPKPYRDAAGIKWHWWHGAWRKVKTKSQRRRARRFADAVARGRAVTEGVSDA